MQLHAGAHNLSADSITLARPDVPETAAEDTQTDPTSDADSSLDLGRPVPDTQPLHEASLDDSSVYSDHSDVQPADPVTYEIITEGTQRQRAKLCKSLGHTYTLKQNVQEQHYLEM